MRLAATAAKDPFHNVTTPSPPAPLPQGGEGGHKLNQLSPLPLGGEGPGVRGPDKTGMTTC